jgi:hypothetical protein
VFSIVPFASNPDTTQMPHSLHSVQLYGYT